MTKWLNENWNELRTDGKMAPRGPGTDRLGVPSMSPRCLGDQAGIVWEKGERFDFGLRERKGPLGLPEDVSSWVRRLGPEERSGGRKSLETWDP